MKKIVLYIVLFTSLVAFGQTNEAAPVAIDAPNQENFNLLNQSRGNQNAGTPLNNTVSIEQIGDANTSLINVTSSSSIVQVSQIGNNNSTAILLRGSNINHRVNQRGNNNSVLDIVPGVTNDVGLDIVQRGNNLSFQRIGVNSLTKDIRVRQSGNSTNQNPIIIRSFR